MKQTTYLIIATAFLLGVSTAHCLAQQDSTTAKLSRFVKNIQSFNRQYPQEKVYLHFDNTGYYLGETIWFKAYVVKADELSPTPLSRVLYVELLNPEGDIVETKKLKVENGQCHGDFQLKDSLFAGYYEVRAYTRYMLNFENAEAIETGNYQSTNNNSSLRQYPIRNKIQEPRDTLKPALAKILIPGNGEIENTCTFSTGMLTYNNLETETIFSRVFPVYDRPIDEGNYAEKTMYERHRTNKDDENSSEDLKISFYPESGQLIDGIPSRVAFKATSSQGINLNINGYIKNSAGVEIAHLKTTHQGMGCFQITPDGNHCKAEVVFNKIKYNFDLPKSEKNGYILSADTLPDQKLRIKVNARGIPPQQLGLSIWCRGKVKHFETLNIQSGRTLQRIVPLTQLNTGVNEITLYDSNGKILASRLKFINNKDYKDLQLSCTGKKIYKPYEPVTLDFHLTDTLNETRECNFSLAVRDADSEERTYCTDNILSNLLLSSDLKGYIADPAWYFEASDSLHDNAIDLLMLTQGWRRYSWKEMTGIEPLNPEHPVEKGIMIDGILKSKYNEKYPNAQVYISLKGSNKLMKYGDCKTDKNGYFKTLAGDFNGTADLTLVALYENQKRTRKDSIELSDYLFELDRHFSPKPKQAYAYYENNIPEEPAYKGKNLTIADSPFKIQELNTLTVKTKKKKYSKLDSLTPTYRLSGPDEVEKARDYLLLDDGYDRNSDNRMVKFIEQVCMRRGFFNMSGLIIRDLAYYYTYWTEGGPTKEPGPRHSSYSYSDIDSILIYSDLADRKRYNHQYTSPTQENYDIIVKIKSTKKDAPTKWEDGTRRTKLQGYSYISEFYSPDYKNNALPVKKDFRRTLYWNPDVKTDSNGRATVSFFNNSTCKRINISAETVTSDGIPVVYKEDPCPQMGVLRSN